MSAALCFVVAALCIGSVVVVNVVVVNVVVAHQRAFRTSVSIW
ncbi:hypothetical protein HMPREF1584_00634 [Gardnerella vaginalis JCP8481A]|nr:hypothetical protein HMPREF1585_00577 [Gardnerella vaginalis JCP8481B]EPI43226.1 hypothetical protein HMPREF1584_00634 [Gardnerella vaginalis JCP8481A]